MCSSDLEENCHVIHETVDRRDRWIEFYQKMELAKNAQIADHAAYVRELLAKVRAPVTGYVLQEGRSEGLFADGWLQPHAALSLNPQKPVTRLRIRGWRPDSGPAKTTVAAKIDGQPVARQLSAQGNFDLDIDARKSPLRKTFRLELDCDHSSKTEGDNRDLSWVLLEIRAEHQR